MTPARQKAEEAEAQDYADLIQNGITLAAEPSRYELLHADPRFGLSKGDVLICERMHWAWSREKVAVLRRESDGYEPGCSQYRASVRHLSGPKS